MNKLWLTIEKNVFDISRLFLVPIYRIINKSNNVNLYYTSLILRVNDIINNNRKIDRAFVVKITGYLLLMLILCKQFTCSDIYIVDG